MPANTFNTFDLMGWPHRAGDFFAPPTDPYGLDPLQAENNALREMLNRLVQDEQFDRETFARESAANKSAVEILDAVLEAHERKNRPGSVTARERGCTCHDMSHLAEQEGEPLLFITVGCPMHSRAALALKAQGRAQKSEAADG